MKYKVVEPLSISYIKRIIERHDSLEAKKKEKKRKEIKKKREAEMKKSNEVVTRSGRKERRGKKENLKMSLEGRVMRRSDSRKLREYDLM